MEFVVANNLTDRKFRIYNLYPKLVGKMEDWKKHFDRIKEMDFDYIYVNPVNSPGLSGSDYAIKNHYLFHPLYVNGTMDFSNLDGQKEKGTELFKMVCEEVKKRGMSLIMDIVVNHTAIDSELIDLHPEWYVKNKDGSIRRPGCFDKNINKWIEWEDLADIDNESSSDKENLWKYWFDMVIHYCKLGVGGFRCDAAYMVPSDLWVYLISKTKQKYPDVIFIGETLGCEPEEAANSAAAGFDLIMNSFKWWDYKSNWFIKEYNNVISNFPSLAFPENHDTTRTATEVSGNERLVVMKYALSAFFSTGVAATLGFEYGFQKRIDVVNTRPDWYEDYKFNIQEEIRRINELKGKYRIFNQDNKIAAIDFSNDKLFGYTKTSKADDEKVMILANTDGDKEHNFFLKDFFSIMPESTIDISIDYRVLSIPRRFEYKLKPGEVKVFYSN